MSRSKNIIKAATTLLAFVTVSLVACGGKEAVAPEDVEREAIDDFRQTIEEVIEDPDREAEIMALVDGLYGDFRNLRESVTKRRTELRRLNADYDATREQFGEFIEVIDAEIKAERKSVTQRRIALVEATTEQEWDALKKAETKTMKTMVGVIQSI